MKFHRSFEIVFAKLLFDDLLDLLITCTVSYEFNSIDLDLRAKVLLELFLGLLNEISDSILEILSQFVELLIRKCRFQIVLAHEAQNVQVGLIVGAQICPELFDGFEQGDSGLRMELWALAKLILEIVGELFKENHVEVSSS